MQLLKILKDRRGSTFLEIALWIVLFVLAVAPLVHGLATETGNKFNQMKDRVSQVGG